MSVNILDDPASYKKIDPGGMLRLVTEFPAQMDEAYQIGRGFKAPQLKGVNQILVCGLGGAGLGAAPPRGANKKPLVIASSFSGNREESLDAYTEAKPRRCPVLCITTGGKLL